MARYKPQIKITGTDHMGGLSKLGHRKHPVLKQKEYKLIYFLGFC
jgi:hypothetical protein